MRCHSALGIFASTITNVVEDIAAQTNVRIVCALTMQIVIKGRFAVENTCGLMDMENIRAIALGQSAD